MFALKMFHKGLIASGFHIHHFKTLLKCFYKTFYQKRFQTYPNKDGIEQ